MNPDRHQFCRPADDLFGADLGLIGGAVDCRDWLEDVI